MTQYNTKYNEVKNNDTQHNGLICNCQHDTQQHQDAKHNHNSILHNDAQNNYIICDTQEHNKTQHQNDTQNNIT